MPPKQTLDKVTWQWAESTDPNNIKLEHVRTAYRLNVKPCKPGSCRRNCKTNPYCLNAIGERSWFTERNDDSWHDIEDPNEQRRADNTYAGLKNLGATCYVNTFLQLWFHNPIIRTAIYKFREQDPPLTEKEIEVWLPSSIGGHLQALFASLEFTKRASVDPDSFITHLGLDAGQQQDAQEFSKLFLCLLEDALSQQDVSVRNVIQQQFRGDYAYVTTCSKCGNSSERLSEFYELDLNIRGHKTLEESILDFLGEEKLDGDNQYMCSHCSSKQNAKRAIQLKNLPPVLNLQLLRFVFDKKSGHKKKLNSFIQFPEVLDMGKILEKSKSKAGNQKSDDKEGTSSNEQCSSSSAEQSSSVYQNGNNIYDLKAVLIHRGPTAYSGHYTAHIKKNDVWYKFNDEEVEKMKGSNLHLGMEDDLQEGSVKQKGSCPKGYYSSRNAYMLVYEVRTNDSNEPNGKQKELSVNASELLPYHVMEYVTGIMRVLNSG
ncbi:hypothetical protein KUTeg_020394 [Tegillarca granosa]|uniref:ubiquitinyl hydrolase 1 n=1 Tax=Tegillarca granosa TaxID=220873 RepID=A0ABQ9ECX1_TEGGR|nr:hypothetical protein KUTeg_020394 [Tegillarca granosa]